MLLAIAIRKAMNCNFVSFSHRKAVSEYVPNKRRENMAEVDIHAPGVECIKTQCYFCHANCGVLAYVKDGEVIKIEGDPD